MLDARTVLLNGMTIDDADDMHRITIYRMAGAAVPFRFRIAWILARLAFWIWTR